MNKVFIGVDPDVEKSGVTFYNPEGKAISLNNYSFFELFEYLQETRCKFIILVVIEAGWLNKSNWHAYKNGSAAINAQIGQRTGANHETGKKIIEMCQYLELPFELVKPTRSKVGAQTFAAITGIKSRTNQEQRDSAMLVYGRK